MSDDRIHILYLIPSLRMGGAEIQLLSLLRGLNKKVFNPFVGVFYRGHELDEKFRNVRDVQIVYFEKRDRYDLLFYKNLLALMKVQRFHIVQCYNVSARLFGILAAKKAHIPNIIVTERSAQALYSSAGSRIYQFFESFAMRHAKVLVANSQAGRHFAISRGIMPEKIRVIYNGVDPQRFKAAGKTDVRSRYGISEHDFVVGSIARLESQKDPMTFLNAAHIIYKKIKNIRFMFVGNGSLLNDVKQSAEKIGLSDKVVFTGYQEHISPFLDTMDVFVLCSRTTEGCSNAILEALVMGKPVVATDVGGNREIVVEKVGFLVKPKDPLHLADTIMTILQDRKLLNQMSKNARIYGGHKFSQHAMVSAYEELYRELN